MNKKSKKKDIGARILFSLLGGTLAGIFSGNPIIGMVTGICVGIVFGLISLVRNAWVAKST